MEYKTTIAKTEGLYREKGRKFIAYLHPVREIEEVKHIMEACRSEHPKARHHCFAYRLGSEGQEYRHSDDGEPSGSAGLPIYNQLLSAQITNVLCIVVRYFGGTKLGIPGLITAYKSATLDAVNSAEIVDRKRSVQYQLKADYTYAYKLLEACKKAGADILSKDFGDIATFQVGLDANEHSTKLERIIKEALGLLDYEEIPENTIQCKLTFEER